MTQAVAHPRAAPNALKPLRWTGNAASAVGTREENQDAYWFPDRASSSEEAVFIVADGMGGGQFGGLAAQRAIGAVLGALQASRLTAQTQSQPDRLREAIARANTVVHEMQQDALEDRPTAQVGCALAVGVLRRRTLTIAHVGDVRVYLWRRGDLKTLTQDHSWAAEFGEDKGAQGMRHVLSRAIGPKAEVEPDISTHTVEAGDVVVFCTDGVWAAVPETQMAHLIAHTTPSALAGRLVQTAQAQDNSDNATALVVALDTDSQPVGQWLVIGVGVVLLALVGLVAVSTGLFASFRLPFAGEPALQSPAPPSNQPADALPADEPTPASKESNASAHLAPQPTATLAVMPIIKVCSEDSFNHSQGRCAHTMPEIPQRLPIYVSWEPPTARLQRAQVRRKDSLRARTVSLSEEPLGYLRLEARDFANRLSPNVTYVVELQFANLARSAEVSFKITRNPTR